MKSNLIPGVLVGVFLGVAVGISSSSGYLWQVWQARILGESVDFFRKGQIALRDGKASAPQTVKR